MPDMRYFLIPDEVETVENALTKILCKCFRASYTGEVCCVKVIFVFFLVFFFLDLPAIIAASCFMMHLLNKLWLAAIFQTLCQLKTNLLSIRENKKVKCIGCIN